MFAKRKGLDTILASFDRVMTDLDKLQVENLQEVQSNKAVIERLEAQNGVLVVEAQKADRIHKNIAQLLGK